MASDSQPIQLLLDNPLLLLFLVAAIGYPLGRIRFRGVGVGVAAVLFVGLAIGSLHPDLKLPDTVYMLGLVLFVYTVGLSSGPGFFSSFGRTGLANNLLAVSVVLLAGLACATASRALNLRPTLVAGVFAGSLTNSPALAAVLEYVKAAAPPSVIEQMLLDPVVGYSITYPMGVVGVILAIILCVKLWRVDYAAEANEAHTSAIPQKLANQTVRVTNANVVGHTIQQLVDRHGWQVVFARLKRGDELLLVDGQVKLEMDDQLSVVGAEDQLARVVAQLGQAALQRLDFDRSELDHRRMFVSNPALVGRRLKDLELQKRYGAVVTRVRRGDAERLPTEDTVLELGDQVRVLAHRQRLEDLQAVFGDSYRALSEIDVLSFSMGTALGLLLGAVPIPLPGGIVLRLGFAGGPLIAGLILGARGRTGPVIWTLPYSANLVLRQIGLVLFLAGIGTRSGYAFVSMLGQGVGVTLFLLGAFVTFLAAMTALLVGYRVLKIPMSVLIGMLAGIHTQPAVLGFALEQTNNELPNVGYATVYPVAMVAKIMAAQLLLSLLL